MLKSYTSFVEQDFLQESLLLLKNKENLNKIKKSL